MKPLLPLPGRLALLAGAVAAGLCQSGLAFSQSGPGACEAWGAKTIEPAGISLPTRGAVIASAKYREAEPRRETAAGLQLELPAHCQLRGAINPVDPAAPKIEFQVNLPTVWNGNSMHYGGSAFDGVLITGLAQRYPQPPEAALPLTRGYATFGSDAGHQTRDGAIAEFALNDEALRNFGHEQLKKTKDVAFALIQAYYGRLPAKSYFNGHSNGGREALVVAQRYPDDYDGVVAVTPVLNFVATQLHGNAVATALTDGGWMEPAKVELLSRATLAACDGDDKAQDGIIGDPASCRHDAAALRCPGGTDEGPHCLSSAQVWAVTMLRKPLLLPFPLAHGIAGYEGWPAHGKEAAVDGWDRWVMGKSAPVRPVPVGPKSQPGIGSIGFYGQTFVRYFVAQSETFDPYGFDPASKKERIQYLSGLIDATDPNLSRFFGRGGKLIITENLADSAQSGQTGIAYYERVVATLGETARASVVLYNAPGVSHFGQNAPGKADLIALMSDWVEKGQAPPAKLTQIAFDPKTLKPASTRAMCRHPAAPVYLGQGLLTEAASFGCR